MSHHSPAKINLWLKVGPVEQNGYHPVDTIIHLLEFGDDITLEPAGELTVTCEPELDLDQADNLAYRAAVAMGEAFDQPTSYHIHITKRIPAGAGLGGGSSNAATVVRALADQWGIALDDPRLLVVARNLGADVVAFLAATPCTQLVGYGDVIESELPPRTGLPFVLVMVDDAHASTAQVYQTFDKVGTSDEDNLFINDLAYAAHTVCPQTGYALDWLRMQPQTVCAQVSGSGACCFALVESDADARTLADEALQQGFWSVATTLK